MKNLSSSRPDRERFTILAVSADEEDHATLRRLLDGDSLQLETARSCGEAGRYLDGHIPSLVVCEKDLPDGSWRHLISRMGSLFDAPPVIVIARQADERLWAEVLNVGGYDVLAKPLEPIEVVRVVRMASRHMRQPRLETHRLSA